MTKFRLFLQTSSLVLVLGFTNSSQSASSLADQKVRKPLTGSAAQAALIQAQSNQKTETTPKKRQTRSSKNTQSPLVEAPNVKFRSQANVIRERDSKTREMLRQLYADRLESIYGSISYDKTNLRNPAFNPQLESSWLELMMLSEVYGRLALQSRVGFQDTNDKSLDQILKTLSWLKVSLGSELPQSLQNTEVKVSKLDGTFTLASVLDQIQELDLNVEITPSLKVKNKSASTSPSVSLHQ